MMLSHSSLSHSKSDNAVHQSVRNASFLSQFVVLMILLLTTSTSSPTVSSSSSSSAPFTHPLPSLFNTTSVHSFVRGFQYLLRDVVAPVPSIVGITDNNSFAFVEHSHDDDEDTAFEIIVVDMEAPLVFYTPPTTTAAVYASWDDAPFFERILVGVIVDGVRLCRTVHGLTREGVVVLRSVRSRLHRFLQNRNRVRRHNVRVLRYQFRVLCQFLYRVFLFSCLTVVMGALVVLSVNLYFEMKFLSAGWCGAFLLLCFVYNWFLFGYVRTFIVFMSLVFVATSRGCFNADRCLVLVLALALVSSNIVSIVLCL